jgi:hypothetical protein
MRQKQGDAARSEKEKPQSHTFTDPYKQGCSRNKLIAPIRNSAFAPEAWVRSASRPYHFLIRVDSRHSRACLKRQRTAVATTPPPSVPLRLREMPPVFPLSRLSSFSFHGRLIYKTPCRDPMLRNSPSF